MVDRRQTAPLEYGIRLSVFLTEGIPEYTVVLQEMFQLHARECLSVK